MTRLDRSRSDAGFTLLELLVALTLTAMMTALVTWGIDLGRRAWVATSDRGQSDEIEAGIERLRDLVSKATPSLELDPQMRIARLAYSGQETRMTFVTLSEGTALESGLVRVHVIWEPDAGVSNCKGAVIVKEGIFRSLGDHSFSSAPAILFRCVKRFALRYFGSTTRGEPEKWETTWRGADQMPRAVRAEIDLEQAGTERHLVVPIRLRHALAP
jgi:general secretion pathway protein J